MSEVALLEPPALPAVPTTRPALADLILLRLLPEKKSIGSKQFHDDLAMFFRQPLTADEVADSVATLKAEGFIVPKKGQRATDAGRARALRNLGIEKLPPRANWPMIKAKYLVPRALGLSPDSAEYTKVVEKGESFAAFLLKRKLGLSADVGNTLNAVVGALICRELGHPEFTDLSSLTAAMLGQAIGGEPIKRADAKKVLPRIHLDVTGFNLEKLRAAVLGGRIDFDEEPKTNRRSTSGDVSVLREEPFDLETFANTVKSVARKCPTGRFGGYKVFINHVWNQLRDEPPFAALGLDGFKQKLVEANRANLLTLSRADLVQLMDPVDVRESETTYLTATFHFILVEKD